MLDKRKLIIGKWPHFVQSNYAVYSAIYQILVNTIKLVKKKKSECLNLWFEMQHTFCTPVSIFW